MPTRREKLEWAEEVRNDTDRHSFLAEHLMREWAWGRLSAPKVQQIAFNAEQDGLNHPKVARLAALGSSGTHPRNMYQQMVALCDASMLPDGFVFTVPWKDGCPRGYVTMAQTMLLPHELFACMYKHYPKAWKKRMVPDNGELRQFWEEMAEHPNMQGHPVQDRICNRNRSWMDLAVPLTLHGDGVPVTGVGKAVLFSTCQP